MTLPATALPLRPYQRDAIAAIRDAHTRGIRRQLVVLPTGAGKTVVFSHLAAERVDAGRTLVIAHREELLRQAADKLSIVAPNLRVGTVQAGRDEHRDVDVIVASIQTLAQPHRLAPLVGTVSTIVVDEAHHTAARTYLSTLEALGAFDADGPLLVGVTATAGRADQIALGSAFQEIVYRRGILEMIIDGYLCDVRGMEITTDLDYSTLTTSRGDYTDSSLSAAMQAGNAIEAAAVAYSKYATDRPGIAFTPTIDTAEALASELSRRGIRSEHVSGLTPRDQRADILHRLHAGHLQVVTNAAVLTEGFDEPRVSCVLIARPTKSPTLFTQMAGRGLRLHPGKTDCLLLTVAGPPDSGLATIATLAGKDPRGTPIQPKDGETLTEAVERAEGDHQRRLAASAVTAKRVALFGRSGLRWVQVDGAYALGCGDAMLIVRPTSDDRWKAISVPRDGDPRTIGDNLTLEYAQGVAEEFARGSRSRLARADAPWRARPVTERQRQLLDKLRLGPVATAGEASDLIDAWHARKQIAKLDRREKAA